MFYWFSAGEGTDQQVLRAGVDVGAFMVPLGPIRCFPHFKLGLEHRRLEPHDGMAAMVGVGLEAALMLGRRLQIASAWDRNFGFPSGTRNEMVIELRWGYVTRVGRLAQAAEEGNVEAARSLLDKGTDPNRRSGSSPPLYSAARRCDARMLELLLDRGLDRRDYSVELSLRTAVTHCSAEVVGLLLEKGADPNANYYRGGTVLMDAVEAGKVEAVDLLLAHEADPNGRGRYEPPPEKPDPEREQHRIKEKECEATALMLAVKHGNYDIAKKIVEAGADVKFVDTFGCTALKIGEREGRAQIVELLRLHGAAP